MSSSVQLESCDKNIFIVELNYKSDNYEKSTWFCCFQVNFLDDKEFSYERNDSGKIIKFIGATWKLRQGKNPRIFP